MLLIIYNQSFGPESDYDEADLEVWLLEDYYPSLSWFGFIFWSKSDLIKMNKDIYT